MGTSEGLCPITHTGSCDVGFDWKQTSGVAARDRNSCGGGSACLSRAQLKRRVHAMKGNTEPSPVLVHSRTGKRVISDMHGEKRGPPISEGPNVTHLNPDLDLSEAANQAEKFQAHRSVVHVTLDEVVGVGVFATKLAGGPISCLA